MKIQINEDSLKEIIAEKVGKEVNRQISTDQVEIKTRRIGYDNDFIVEVSVDLGR